MIKSRWKTALYLSTAFVAGISTSAYAQTAPANQQPAASDLSTVVVTARRIDERLQDVPISITVFSQQALANENVVNAEDLARITPSLSANSNYGSDNTSFAIRGFIQEQGTAPTVGVYFGDVVAPRGPTDSVTAGDGAGAGSFFDLQNVQVLKGPQGTLQGRNTTGGAVLLVPQKPTGNFDGYVEASYGNFDMRRIQAVVNIPINDNIRFRAGVDDQVRDGYLNNISDVGPKHFGNVNYTALRASLVVDITPNLENYTIASYSNSHNYGDVQKINPGGAASLPGYTLPAAATTSGYYDVMNTVPNPESKLTTWQIINTTTWHATDNVTVTNIASYAELQDDIVSSLFGANVPFSFANFQGLVPPGVFPTGTYNLPFADVVSLAGGHLAHEATVTEEFRLNGNALDNRLTWQGGFYSEFALPIGTVGTQSPTLASCPDPTTLKCTDPLGLLLDVFTQGAVTHVGTVATTALQTSDTDYGLYGQATYKLTDQLKLTGGYRYTWDRSAVRAVITGTDVDYPPNYGVLPIANNPFCAQPATAPSCSTHTYADSSKPTWLLGLDYTPVQDLLLYVKYARGYRAGTISANLTPPLNVARPESVDSYELGVKSTLHGPIRATFDADVFYNDFTNQQIQLGFNSLPGSGLASTAAPVNAGASTIYGLELSSSINPAPGLVLSVGYTYLHTRIDQVTDFSNISTPGFQTAAFFKVGDPIVLTPENKAVFDVNYQLLFVPSKMGKMSVGGSLTHTDKTLANYIDGQSATPAALQKYAYLPETDLLDLRASWVGIYGAPVDLSFFATNVTGKKYYVMAAGLGTAGLGFESTEQGLPTMFGVRLKYHFGR